MITDQELVEGVLEFREGILNGRSSFKACYMVCLPLQGYLSFLGIETELVMASFPEINHCWLRLADGRILDPTADQFGFEPVYLGFVPLRYETREARIGNYILDSLDSQA